MVGYGSKANPHYMRAPDPCSSAVVSERRLQLIYSEQSQRRPHFNEDDPKWRCLGTKHVLTITKILCLLELIFIVALTAFAEVYLQSTSGNSPLATKYTFSGKGNSEENSVPLSNKDDDGDSRYDTIGLMIKCAGQLVTMTLLAAGLQLKKSAFLIPHWVFRLVGGLICVVVALFISLDMVRLTGLCFLIEIPLFVVPARAFEYLIAREADLKHGGGQQH